MDVDFAVTCPLVRPGLPHIRFLFVRSRFCSTLLSDPASRRRPCASLALHLHQVVQGTCTPQLSNMLGTQVSRSRGRMLHTAQRSKTAAYHEVSFPSSSISEKTQPHAGQTPDPKR
jgi:hypothetical protein